MAKTTYALGGPVATSGTFSGKVAFSNGVKVTGGELLFISGQLAKDGNSELLGKGDIKAQTRQVLENIKKVPLVATGLPGLANARPRSRHAGHCICALHPRGTCQLARNWCNVAHKPNKKVLR